MASTIMRSELMRGTQGFWRSSYVRIAEPSARSSAILYARRSRTGRWPRPGSTSRMARLAARHTILDVIGCLLTNRCQVEKLLFLWIGLQPLWQVADIWPLRRADNRPNPCGTQFPHLKARAAILRQAEPFDRHSKTAPTRLFPRGGPTRKHTTLLQIGKMRRLRRRVSAFLTIDRVLPSSDLGVKRCQPGVLELSGISLVSL